MVANLPIDAIIPLLAANSTLIHWHLLRHTFAVNYLVNGGDPFSLQRIMGHTTLEMVRRYMHLADVHVRLQHRRYSPMDVMQAATRQHAPAHQRSKMQSRHQLALAR
jgi:integrase